MKPEIVTVYDFSLDNLPPTNALEFRDWLDGLIESIPYQFRESATLDIEADIAWGDPVLRMVLQYTRTHPESAPKPNKPLDPMVANMQRRAFAQLAKPTLFCSSIVNSPEYLAEQSALNTQMRNSVDIITIIDQPSQTPEGSHTGAASADRDAP